METYSFTYENVITRPYRALLRSQLNGGEKPITNQYVKYRKISFSFVPSSERYLYLQYGKINQENWLHKYPAETGICVGAENNQNIYNIVFNKNLSFSDKYNALYIIFKDYFSICTEEHWDYLEAPKDKECIDEYELYECCRTNYIKHKSTMSEKILDVSKKSADFLISQNLIKVPDNMPPISLKFYTKCKYCGRYYFNEKDACNHV